MKLNSIKDVLDYLNTIPYINRGGCAIAALAVYLWAKQNNKLPEDFEIWYLHYWTDDYNDNQNYLAGNNSWSSSCTHAVIYYDGKIVDSNTEDVNTAAYGRHILSIPKSMVETFILDTLDNIYMWNPDFNREKYVPQIEEKLNITLTSIFV